MAKHITTRNEYAQTPFAMSETERLAVERVRRARVSAPDEVILEFVRSGGPELILKTKLRDINAVANAF
jgi:hypothetical protein